MSNAKIKFHLSLTNFSLLATFITYFVKNVPTYVKNACISQLIAIIIFGNIVCIGFAKSITCFSGVRISPAIYWTGHVIAHIVVPIILIYFWYRKKTNMHKNLPYSFGICMAFVLVYFVLDHYKLVYGYGKIVQKQKYNFLWSYACSIIIISLIVNLTISS